MKQRENNCGKQRCCGKRKGLNEGEDGKTKKESKATDNHKGEFRILFPRTRESNFGFLSFPLARRTLANRGTEENAVQEQFARSEPESAKVGIVSHQNHAAGTEGTDKYGRGILHERFMLFMKISAEKRFLRVLNRSGIGIG